MKSTTMIGKYAVTILGLALCIVSLHLILNISTVSVVSASSVSAPASAPAGACGPYLYSNTCVTGNGPGMYYPCGNTKPPVAYLFTYNQAIYASGRVQGAQTGYAGFCGAVPPTCATTCSGF